MRVTKLSVDQVRYGSTDHHIEKKDSDADASVGVAGRLADGLGLRFMVAISATEHLLRGFNETALQALIKFVFADYALPATTLGIYAKLTGLPWCLKCGYGLLSDMLPVFGYRKLPYMAITTVIGCVCSAVLGLTPTLGRSAMCTLFLFTGAKQQVSVCDLLTKASYSERLKQKPELGPDLMTFLWGGLVAVSLLTSIIVGPELERFGYQPILIACAVTALLVIWPIGCNYLQEEPIDADELSIRRRKLCCAEIMVPSFAISAAALMLFGMSLDPRHETKDLMRFAILCSCIVCGSVMVTMRRTIGCAVIFLYLSQIQPSFDGASFYFFTDGEEILPDGPHFSKLFYVTGTSVAGDVAQLVFLYFYSRFLKDTTYKTMYYVAICVQSSSYGMDYLIFSGMNRSLGIPDQLFVIGSSAVHQATDALFNVATLCLLSQLCPKGREAATFAILVSLRNVNKFISGIFGAFVLDQFGVVPTGLIGDTEQLANLQYIPIVAGLWGMLALPLVPLCVPDARMNEKVQLGESDDSSDEGASC